MNLTRRGFLQASATSLAFTALARAVRAQSTSPDASALQPLDGPLAIPPGFEQTVFSRAGSEMSDGLLVPGYHDGMAAFSVAGDASGSKVLLVRNHEIDPAFGTKVGPFGEKLERLRSVDRALLYDAGYGLPCLGGTTTVVYDLRTRRVERQFLSLSGTGVNCAGGATPWGTWISCEEWTQAATPGKYERDHGWAFEVPADPNGRLTAPRRLPGLGRFKHEAVACHPNRRIVYLTEDLGDGCLYRFVADIPGDLAGTGRLQALAAVDRPSLDARNWPTEVPKDGRIERAGEPFITVRPREPFAVRWIDVDDVAAPKDDLRFRAFAAGAIRFARCEGITLDGDHLYVAATTGGPAMIGQVWRYRLSDAEGEPLELGRPASLELFVESTDSRLLKNADNLTVAPATSPAAGQLFICEDGLGADGIVRILPDGRAHRFALNMLNASELAGVTFSPDGSTLFVNLQNPGMTIAINGPWETLRG